jgi:hypothetical protein
MIADSMALFRGKAKARWFVAFPEFRQRLARYFAFDRIAIAQDRNLRVIEIVGGINRIATALARKIICETCALEQAERQAPNSASTKSHEGQQTLEGREVADHRRRAQLRNRLDLAELGPDR